MDFEETGLQDTPSIRTAFQIACEWLERKFNPESPWNLHKVRSGEDWLQNCAKRPLDLLRMEGDFISEEMQAATFLWDIFRTQFDDPDPCIPEDILGALEEIKKQISLMFEQPDNHLERDLSNPPPPNAEQASFIKAYLIMAGERMIKRRESPEGFLTRIRHLQGFQPGGKTRLDQHLTTAILSQWKNDMGADRPPEPGSSSP